MHLLASLIEANVPLSKCAQLVSAASKFEEEAEKEGENEGGKHAEFWALIDEVKRAAVHFVKSAKEAMKKNPTLYPSSSPPFSPTPSVPRLEERGGERSWLKTPLVSEGRSVCYGLAQTPTHCVAAVEEEGKAEEYSHLHNIHLAFSSSPSSFPWTLKTIAKDSHFW